MSNQNDNTKLLLEYQMLYATLRYHKFVYYQLADNEITDGSYDYLERRFDQIARQCGWPGSWVGSRDESTPE